MNIVTYTEKRMNELKALVLIQQTNDVKAIRTVLIALDIMQDSEDFQLEMTSDEAVLALLDLAISEAIDFIYTVSKSFNINIKAVYPAMAKYFEGFETYCDEGHPLWEN